MSALPKKYVQVKGLDIVTRVELEDVRDCRINQGMIDKLVKLCKTAVGGASDAQYVYCAAMAVGTI